MNADFPSIFIRENNIVNSFISKEEIESCQSLQQLKDLILSKLSKHGQHYYSNL